jgi:hypothetical protein
VSSPYRNRDVFSAEAVSDEEDLIASIRGTRNELRPDKTSRIRFLQNLDHQHSVAESDISGLSKYISFPSAAGAPDNGRDAVLQKIFATHLRSHTQHWTKVRNTEPSLHRPPTVTAARPSRTAADDSVGEAQPVIAGKIAHEKDNSDLATRLLEALEYSTTDFRTTESLARELDVDEHTIRRGLHDLGDTVRRPLGQQSKYPNWWRLTKKGPTRGEQLARMKAVLTFSRMDDNF